MRIQMTTLTILLALAGCKPSDAPTADEVLSKIDEHLGKRVALKAKIKSGARCAVAKDGEFKTYCKDCQYCRGPAVVGTKLDTKKEGLDDWPMILVGQWKGKTIRCKGPLGEVVCEPFDEGKEYLIQGRLEKMRPPRLVVQDAWEL